MAGLRDINITVAENGYKICACHEKKKSISQKNGWIPSMHESKEYVAKNKEELFAQLTKIMKECK